MLAVASMMVLAFGVLSPLLLGDQPHFSGSPAELAATAIMLACAAGFVWLFIVRIGRAPLGTVGWGTFHLNRDMGFGVLGYVATTSVLITLLLAKGASLQYFWQELTSFSLGQRLQFLLIGVQVVVLEETLFRGYLQSGLEARTSRPRAVVITALAFAAYHLRFDDPMLFAAQFCYGLVWGALKTRTRSLYASSTAHFLNWAISGAI